MQGPYPNMRTTILLPSPKTGNMEQLRASVQILRTMDGTVYTYRKPKRGRRLRRWDFVTTKEKAKETKEFVKLYAGGLVRIVDHEERQHIGYMTVNPWESLGEGRAGGWANIEEAVRFTIEFEERV